VSEILKHPGVADYWHCVFELDAALYLHLKLSTAELQHAYVLSRDAMLKNQDLLRTPNEHEDIPDSMF